MEQGEPADEARERVVPLRPEQEVPAVGRGAPLGATRKALPELVNGRSGVSPEMAIRLSKAFGGSPEVWLRMQMNHDLWRAQRKADEIKVERYEPA